MNNPRLFVAAGMCLLGVPSLAGAQLMIVQPATLQVEDASGVAKKSEASAGAVNEIVVTAQKRGQSINAVGMSITAATGDALLQRGITNTESLGKLVPGFVYAPSITQTPVYTIRGIGLYDNTLASSPTVSVYTDEVPLPFPVMTPAASLDLERVEVLKGPQGTLFGQNSTGGAINYIAAKPTAALAAGADVSYERFGRIDGSGFISGPLTSTLKARLAVRSVEGGDWQYSQSRPGDRLGDERKLFGRLLLDWEPASKLKVSVNLNGFRDHSDAQGLQLIDKVIFNPADTAAPLILGAPLSPDKARVADWTAINPMRSHNRFLQGAARVDYQLTDILTLTSLTSYADMKYRSYTDQDGTIFENVDNFVLGNLKTFNQEVRLSGNTSELHWIVGGSYEHDHVDESNRILINDNTLSQPVPSVPRIFTALGTTDQRIRNYAFFGNADYNLTSRLNVQAGIRYTNSRRYGRVCASDPSPENSGGQQFNALQQIFIALGLKNTPFVPIASGQCYLLDATLTPTINPFPVRLSEHNVSWRFGANYKFAGGALVYANVSRGYKAGAIVQINASATSEFVPAKQERVDAYEAGFKTPLFDRKLHLNGAAFYYNYKDKQVRGSVEDPIFGLLEQLINVPKSRIYGFEGDAVLTPMRGLDLAAGLAYVVGNIRGSFDTYNRQGIFANYGGSRLPYTPRLTGTADGQYRWELVSGVKPFVGSSLTYHSSDNATFRTGEVLATIFNIRSYALVDVRAGISSANDRWRLTVFGRNITNKFYWVGITRASDTIARNAAKPATYGVSLSVRM